MRIAAFNVENLFDRAKVFNSPDKTAHQDVLDAHAELNKLFEKDVYSGADKARMLVLIGHLGMLKRDEGRYTRIRKIRGQIISRPRAPKKPFIKANGRDDWIGWCELRTSAVDEVAVANTARMIRDVAADVLAIVEAESRPVLLKFQELMMDKLGLQEAYRHIMLIDGNDGRGIDVGLATRAGYPIGNMRSHVDDLKPDGHRIFSRDCPEYEVTTPRGNRLVVLPNHFKSKFGGNDPASRAKRLAQSEAVASYYQRLRNEGFDNIAVLGDLNDTPDSPEMAPLLNGTDLKDVSDHPKFTEVQFDVQNGNRGIGTHGLGNDDDKIDYLLLSPALFAKVTRGGIERRGVWPGSRPKRWDVYPELKKKHHAASDHHAIWADIDV
ncbi:endonuclease/exonuclease/phosphatase family protein [Roseibium sp.]|uniref:endonuclease/exonuclease/phosphatase family protein n=1 Tax=Roseibium sp. TaxID=1936156 RepID=UPI003A97B2CA